MVSPSVLLPLYIYPSGSAWSALYTAISNYPSITFNVVVNPDSGPGSSTAPDSNYIKGIKTLNGYSNVKTLGYVHTSYAGRAIADVESDIASYSNWATYSAADIHMDGIFFDEAPSDDSDVSYMTSAADFARSNFTTTPFITFNPGVAVGDGYYAEADLVLACEDTYSDFSSSSSSYISAVSGEASKSAFMINTFSGSQSKMSTLVNQIYSGGIGSMYVTTTSDYSALGSGFTSFMSAIASPGSVSSSSTSSSSTSSSASSSATSTIASSTTSAQATTSATAASTSAAQTTSTSTTPTPTPTQSSQQNKQVSKSSQNNNQGGRYKARWIPRSWGIKALADLVD